MDIGGEHLTAGVVAFAIVAIFFGLFFEFINGFHDTANAVATVIYTHSLPPTGAVVWSGLWNFIGVLTSTGAVAYGIVALLPPTLVLNVASGTGAAALFALLLAAVIWNFGTWYLGLPCSSSHSLIGAIIGVSLTDSFLHSGRVQGMRWDQVHNVMMSLLISPIIGFACAALLLILLRNFVHNDRLFQPADPKRTPPGWIRGLLILTCTGVSFAHGSNDGQKGMGLFMLILIVVLPAGLALNPNLKPNELKALTTELDHAKQVFQGKAAGAPPLAPEEARKHLTSFNFPEAKLDANVYPALITETQQLQDKLQGRDRIEDIPMEDRQDQRRSVYLIQGAVQKLVREKQVSPGEVKSLEGSLKNAIDYIPVWVKAAVAAALGLGTMIGWKRIVVTVGEKIGKSHLAYAQGAAAELTTAGTILLADRLGLPVSTTHVLSSGIAGTMSANRSGLQKDTLRNILLAWVLTLPVCFFLGAVLFSGLLAFFFNVLGWK
ncbi:MAG TPA: inorganic phosphate transporter [Chthoniobacterales bacterium]